MFAEIMAMPPKELENAYRITMLILLEMRITVLQSGEFYSRADGEKRSAQALTTNVQQKLKQRLASGHRNGTYRAIVDKVVSQLVEYALGDINHESQFPHIGVP